MLCSAISPATPSPAGCVAGLCAARLTNYNSVSVATPQHAWLGKRNTPFTQQAAGAGAGARGHHLPGPGRRRGACNVQHPAAVQVLLTAECLRTRKRSPTEISCLWERRALESGLPGPDYRHGFGAESSTAVHIRPLIPRSARVPDTPPGAGLSYWERDLVRGQLTWPRLFPCAVCRAQGLVGDLNLRRWMGWDTLSVKPFLIPCSRIGGAVPAAIVDRSPVGPGPASDALTAASGPAG